MRACTARELTCPTGRCPLNAEQAIGPCLYTEHLSINTVNLSCIETLELYSGGISYTNILFTLNTSPADKPLFFNDHNDSDTCRVLKKL